MIYNNKYYFIETDLFSALRVYIFSFLFLTSIIVLVITSLSIWYAFIFTSIILAVILLLESGYISVDNYSKKITVKKLLSEISISNIDHYEYWWNYDFNTGSIEGDNEYNKTGGSKSNNIIVNLVLKNHNKRIAFIETIALDTRHPNDAIYLEQFNNKRSHTVYVQRIDWLMQFLDLNIPGGLFTIDENYKNRNIN